MTFDPERARKDFPILSQRVHGKPLVFLDSAASAQKPQPVIDAISHFYATDYANIHRGVYELSRRATEAVEEARRKVARFIGADPQEIVFVRNATEAINLVAATYGREHVREGDEVLITHMEHHANIVPWQRLCEEKGAALRVAPIDDRGQLVLEEFEALLTPRTRIVSIAHVSNALGTVNPVAEIVRRAHARDIPVLVDGAQAVPHGKIDVRALDCDFYAFSGHKLFGPSGIGVLYGKAARLAAMPPYMGGGEMILSVSFEKTIYREPPYRFEAGTPDIAGVVGLGAAIDYLATQDLDAVAAHESELLAYATDALSAIPDLRIIGTAEQKASVLSFVLDGVHPHDIGTILDREGIAVRTGHHCAQPVMQRFGVPATARASFALYNTRADVDALVRGLQEVLEVFA
ncbi:MAG TPA: cysteine desulfurase [Myxococcota bacterium]